MMIFEQKIGLLVASLMVLFTPAIGVEGPEVRLDLNELDRSNRERLNSYAEILERATPAVVGIYTTRIIRLEDRGRGGPIDEFLRRHYGLAPGDPDDTGERRIPGGIGSGVILSADGYILTNNHVVSDAGEEVDEILVRTASGGEYEARIVGRDTGTDIAVLKIETDEQLSVITMADSDRIRVGDVVFAIGNPMEVGLTVTQGIVSAIGRTDLGILGMGGYENFIQTDASINLGNSGGALVDSEGRMIGINTAILSRTGGNIGIGFAIPSNMARNVMVHLVGRGQVTRGFLGVVPGNLTPDLAESFGLRTLEGAVINRVSEGMPADRAGIRHGDVILEVDGQKIRSAADLRLRISQTEPGTEVVISLVRDGKREELPVQLESLEAATASLERALPLEGVRLEAVGPDQRRRFGIPGNVDGLVVAAVDRQSPYGDTLSTGMVIVEVNGEMVRDRESLTRAMTRRINRVYVWSDGDFGYVALPRP